jgi:hypothetical protein
LASARAIKASRPPSDPIQGINIILDAEHRGRIDGSATLPQVLPSRTEDEMDAIPLEVWTAFEAIAVGGFLILVGYIINKWRK